MVSQQKFQIASSSSEGILTRLYVCTRRKPICILAFRNSDIRTFRRLEMPRAWIQIQIAITMLFHCCFCYRNIFWKRNVFHQPTLRHWEKSKSVYKMCVYVQERGNEKHWYDDIGVAAVASTVYIGRRKAQPAKALLFRYFQICHILISINLAMQWRNGIYQCRHVLNLIFSMCFINIWISHVNSSHTHKHSETHAMEKNSRTRAHWQRYACVWDYSILHVCICLCL